MEAPIMLHRRIHSMTSLTILASPHSPESCMTKYAIVPMKQMARWHNPIMEINKKPSSHNSLGEHELSFFCLELREQKIEPNFANFFTTCICFRQKLCNVSINDVVTHENSFDWGVTICIDVESIIGRLSSSGIKTSPRRWQKLHRVLVLLNLPNVTPHDIPDANWIKKKSLL